MRRIPVLLFALVLLSFQSVLAGATFTVTSINTTVTLNRNTSAHVTETMTIILSNTTMPQYNIDRSGLNLTLSNWQSIVGTNLVPHIINPKTGIYNFNLLPGPVVNSSGSYTARIYINYYVQNVTTVNQTGPRLYVYTFNSDVLNFVHGTGGTYLGPSTELNILLPNRSTIITVYPLPDTPSRLSNLSGSSPMLSWDAGEPLYSFKLVFAYNENIASEVTGFFKSIYSELGILSYILIIAIILLFIVYTYVRARSWG